MVEDIAQRLHRLGAEHGRRRSLLHRVPHRSPVRVRLLPTPLTEQNRQRGRPRRDGSTESKGREEWPWPVPLPRPLLAPNDSERTAQQRKPLLLTEADLRQHQHHRLIRVLAGFEPMTRESFQHAILPALREITPEEIAVRVGLSVSYCSKISRGGLRAKQETLAGV